jgi:hypothetical protein
VPLISPSGVDTLVNTNTADGQISPRVVALADGKYMVIWVGSVILPVVATGGTTAPAYVNADIRAQIYNADGTRSGGEIIINTATAGAQLRPEVAQLSDGNVLITWQDGVGPAGGSAETTPNTIRAQEFTSAGIATGAEFALGNSNGRQHSVAATANGGFVVSYQEGGVGGALAVGNIVARVFNSSNVQTSNFVVDNTVPLATGPFTAVEADGDIIIVWRDRSAINNATGYRQTRFDANGTQLSSFVHGADTISGIVALATGGHAVFGDTDIGPNLDLGYFVQMVSGDGSVSRFIEIARVPTAPFPGTPFLGPLTVIPLANGGFLAS